MIRFGLDAERKNLVNLERPDVHLLLGESLLLYALVFALRPRTVVEVGSYMGGSARIIAQALCDAGQPPTPASFFMIDPEPRLTPENYAFLEKQATIICGASPKALSQLPPHNEGIEFAFLDGDHSESAVYADLVELHEHLSSSALLLCHDAHYAPVDGGINRAVGEMNYRDFGIISKDSVETDQFEGNDRVRWGGLRLLQA